MIKQFIFLILLVFNIGIFCKAQSLNNINHLSKKNIFLVIEADSYLKTKAHFDQVHYELDIVATPKGNFYEIKANGFAKTFDIGRPMLPSYNTLIEIPHDAECIVNITNFEYEDVNLNANGLNYKIMPAQPSYSKSTHQDDIIFEYNQTIYQKDIFLQSTSLLEVKNIGTMRGTRIGQLQISPFAYNPVKNILRIYKNIQFEIIYQNADISKTIEKKKNLFSPIFKSQLNQIINYKEVIPKDHLSQYPIKYVIVSDPMFQNVLQPFIEWKTKKGFYVVEAYTNNPLVGTTTTSIKNYLSGLYNSGTPNDPSPSFILFVGDVAQIPAFSGTTGSHVTDLYYAEYDGGNDYIADVYYGRFSANNVGQLTPQIDKTLAYEKYQMSQTAYLDTVVLVAGVDASFAPIHGNGQINYLTSNYYNSSQGIFSNTYLYPASGSSATQIRNDIYKGIGFGNYTAHCNWNGWGNPSFTNTHVPNMHEGKYSFIISNCCLPNKFNENECFGEALLRASNKGGIGHIGASNNTYWDEDYWFAVGYTSNVIQNPTYQGTGLGAFDRLFHLNNEPEIDWYITGGQIKHAGNLAVSASNTSRKKYYWEAYHLMGDPSLMPYLYVPNVLTATYNNPAMLGASSLNVNTLPYAYVAISHNNQLLNAVKANGNGLAVLNFPAFNTPDTADIVITKQNYQPFIGQLIIMGVQHQIDASTAQIIEPLNQYSCSGIQIHPKAIIRNLGTNTLNSLNISYKINNGTSISYSWSGSLISMATDTVVLPPFALSTGTHTIKIFTSLPNNSSDQNLFNDTLVKIFNVSNQNITSQFTASAQSFCNAPATISFQNQSTNALSYVWDFGDGQTSTDEHPTHTYQNLGLFQVSLLSDGGVCGNASFTLPQGISVGSIAPAVVSAQNCGPATLNLSASGYNTLKWYGAANNSNLLHTGQTFTTPYLNNTTTYYVQGTNPSPVQYVGKTDNSGSGDFFGNTTHWHYLIFDCFAPTTLVSVKVYANGAGIRKIYLRNSSNQILDSTSVYIANGESRITLNFNIPIGTDLQLVGVENVNLYRNNNNTATYPYILSGLISIKESSASLPQYNTPGNYYYYYDWEVKAQECPSIFQPVTAYILDIPNSQFTYSANGLNVQFINQSLHAINSYWTFGDGQTSNIENPLHTYSQIGNYPVKLYVSNICGSDSITQNIVITSMFSPEKNSHIDINVFPMPLSTGFLNITYKVDLSDLEILIYDISGKLIKAFTFENPSPPLIIDMNGFSSGTYFLQLKSDLYQTVKKIVVEH